MLRGQASQLLLCVRDLRTTSGYSCAACNTSVEEKTGSAAKNLLSARRDFNVGAEAWEEVKANKVVLTIVTDKRS